MLEERTPFPARVLVGLACLTPRGLATVAGWAAVLALGSYTACVGAQEVQAMLIALRASVGPWSLLLLALVYGVALAVPFVPGVELGLLIMVAFGTKGVLVAYAATVLGLCLAYTVGCVLPQRLVPTRLRAGGLAERKLAPWVLANRYLTLGVCLNLPGNALVGGGGGIALLCGMSRQFGCVRYLLTVCLAVSPIPILMLTGLSHLDMAATAASTCR